MSVRVRTTLGAAAIAALGFTAFTGAQTPQTGRRAGTPVVAQPPPAALAARGGPSITWDFETGNLAGWTATGSAFANQPTLGDNPTYRGGSAHPQGRYWIGTYESYSGARGGKPGATQGDRPTGTLTSSNFIIQGRIMFLVGGGSSRATRVELQVNEPIDGAFIPERSASGKNSDAMFEVTWDVSSLTGRLARIQIVDESSGPWGHINADYFRFDKGVQSGLTVYTPPPEKLPTQPPAQTPTKAPKQPPAQTPAQPPAQTPVPPSVIVPITVKVPNLVGARDADVARTVLEKAGLRPGKIGSQQSRASKGEIVGQAIPPETSVAPGTAVDFSVATPILTKVPPVVTRPQSAAMAIVEKTDLVAHVTLEESRDPRGTVIRQDPVGGMVVEIGTTVDLVVATPMTVLVPRLVGRTGDAAVAELRKLDLVPGRPVTRETRDAAPGTVIDQIVQAGRRVEIGTTVDFVTAVPETALVPRLIGASRDAALAAIQKVELKAVDGGTKESREPQGTVLSQQPAPGTRLNIGSSVSFVTAIPMTVLVPELVSKPEAEARQLLATAELIVERVTAKESRLAQGSVLTQSIAAGTKVTIGTSVSLEIATPVTVLAPALLARTEADARKALTDLELVVGNIRHEESPATAGTVLSQGVAAGTRTAIGTGVDFVVAIVETTPMPRVIGLTIEAARQALVASRLTAGTPELRESRTDPRGNVVAQPIEPDARVPVGTAIILTVATPAIVSVPSLDGRPHDEAIAAIRDAALTPGGVNFAISWRWRPGGAVIDQDRRPGERVEFGSTVSVTEARSRGWLAGGVSLLLGIAGLVWRKPPTPKRRPPPHDPAHVLAFDISAKPHLDLGVSKIRSMERKAIRSEVRVLPVIDTGTQTVASSGEIVKGERRGTMPPES